MYDVGLIGMEIWFYHPDFEEIMIGTIVGVRQENGKDSLTVAYRQGTDFAKISIDRSLAVFPE